MNRLCRDVGHSWQNTTSDTFRRCNREECKVTERLYRGQWVPVARIVRKPEQTVQEPIQGIMFQ